MTPEQLREFNQMKTLVNELLRAENVAFIESLKRRLFIPQVLEDLTDVSGTNAGSVGQVLKKTATTWQPGTDNTA